MQHDEFGLEAPPTLALAACTGLPVEDGVAILDRDGYLKTSCDAREIAGESRARFS